MKSSLKVLRILVVNAALTSCEQQPNSESLPPANPQACRPEAYLLELPRSGGFILNGELYELTSVRGYRNFWAIYHRPPEQKHRHYLLERRDSLESFAKVPAL